MTVIKSGGVGASGVEISRVGLGGYELGPEPSDAPDVERAVRVIESAIANGVNWLDTSENYLATNNESVVLAVPTAGDPPRSHPSGAEPMRSQPVQPSPRCSRDGTQSVDDREVLLGLGYELLLVPLGLLPRPRPGCSHLRDCLAAEDRSADTLQVGAVGVWEHFGENRPERSDVGEAKPWPQFAIPRQILSLPRQPRSVCLVSAKGNSNPPTGTGSGPRRRVTSDTRRGSIRQVDAATCPVSRLRTGPG